jgi:hypothetical protein
VGLPSADGITIAKYNGPGGGMVRPRMGDEVGQ